MRTPKHVLQVYQNVARYGKDQHNATARRALGRWNEVILSNSGFVEDGRVVLSEEAANPQGLFANSGVLVLNDYNSEYSRTAMFWASSHLSVSPADAAGTAPFGIFGLREAAGAGLELHLRYSDNRDWIGKPSRGDYKLADLRTAEPVRVLINGKTDFSFSAGMERSYLLAEFVFEYLGRFSDFEVRPHVTATKAPPIKRARVIDLTRILY
jgi:hypothetical protein